MNRHTLLENPVNPSTCTRPIELYVFIDPLCGDCWSLQPLLRKLQVEYERYFTLRIVIAHFITYDEFTMYAQMIDDEMACEKTHPAFPINCS